MRRTLLLFLAAGVAAAQHGVIREYAALAPKPDAVPLRPVLDAPLTDVSITLGRDRAYYMTGSAVAGEAAAFSDAVKLWRSPDLRRWSEVRTVAIGKRVRSPEVHYLKGRYWMTLGIEGGGTELLAFEAGDPAQARFRRARITATGEDPSLFLDDDGVFYWVMGAGEVAKMKPDPMDGLAEAPRPMITPLSGELRSHAMRGAHLAKIRGYYHLFVAERRLRFGDMGRTGLAGGTDDVWVAVSSRPNGGYGRARYLAFPHAGQTTLFRDSEGRLRATFSCTDTRGVFRLRPGVFRVEEVDATRAIWPIGFAFNKPDPPVKYAPQGVLLRPDTSFIYEGGAVGSLRPIPMEAVPGQRAPFPWIRDTSIARGPDGVYYMTGTSGNLDAIHLWRSRDLTRFEYMSEAFRFDASRPDLWYNQAPGRLLWAPELHYMNGTYWIAWCVSLKLGMSLLKSTTGKPEGPYAFAYEGNRAFISPLIDASLFEDDDGSPYFVWQGRYAQRMNRERSALEGDRIELLTVDGEQVGYEGVFLRKIGKWYVVTAAEWNGGRNREDGTYDMMYAVSRTLRGPYSKRRVGAPHGGHSTLFQDGAGGWRLAFFGNDRTAPFRAMPGVVALEVRDTGDDLLIGPR
jgi:beta-xylosidase